jgi:hypothetical protein
MIHYTVLNQNQKPNFEEVLIPPVAKERGHRCGLDYTGKNELGFVERV